MAGPSPFTISSDSLAAICLLLVEETRLEQRSLGFAWCDLFACSLISNSGVANCGEGRGDGRGFMAEEAGSGMFWYGPSGPSDRVGCCLECSRTWPSDRGCSGRAQRVRVACLSVGLLIHPRSVGLLIEELLRSCPL
jgi:hypothetical protein